jgi:hypothetical protein
MDDTEQLDSPFLSTELFGRKSARGREPLGAGLLSASPFGTALAPPGPSAESTADSLLDEEEQGIIAGENRVRITNTSGVPVWPE